MYIACGLYAMCCLIAYIYENYFGISNQFKYILISSCVFLFSPYTYIKIGLLRRLNKFSVLLKIEFLSIITSIVAFCFCYYLKIGVYTIAISQVTMVLFRFMAFFAYDNVLIKSEDKTQPADYAFVVNKLTIMLKASIYRTISANLEYYILPIFLPKEQFSFIAQGRKISQIPSDFASMMFNPPMQSLLKERKELADYIPLLFFIIGLCAMFSINLLSPYIIAIYLGEKWMAVSDYLELYSLIIPIFFLNIICTVFFVTKESFSKYLILSKINSVWLVTALCVSLLLNFYLNYNYAKSFVILYSLILPCFFYILYNTDCTVASKRYALVCIPSYYLGMCILLLN